MKPAESTNTTPIEAEKGRIMLTSTPEAATSAPPSPKARAEVARASMPTSGAKRGDTATAHGGTGLRARQQQIEATAEHHREAQREQPVRRDRAAQHLHGTESQE